MSSAGLAAPIGADHSKRVLDPIERVSEVLFGLIMVLTFTGSISVASAGHAEVRTMLVGALGCNVAWGIIDGLLYLMGCLAEKGRALGTLHAVRGAADPETARRLIADALPPLLASFLEPQQLEGLRERLAKLPEPSSAPRLQARDWRGGAAVFVLVFASTLPVVIPFVLAQDPTVALRVSNGIAIVMLFACGYTFGRLTRYHPWWTGLAMVVLGALLASMTMALGG